MLLIVSRETSTSFFSGLGISSALTSISEPKVDDVEGIESLRWEDQKMIRKYVDYGVGNGTTTSTTSSCGNAKLEYGIEVSQTSRAACKKCSENILKGERQQKQVKQIQKQAQNGKRILVITRSRN